MEYADGGDLSTKIKNLKKDGQRFEENEIINYFSQICEGMKYCHDKKLLHRDIKSQNIFLTSDGKVKIGDFGISKILESTKENVKTLVGTPWYLSPEIIENQWYNLKSDIYALGVVLYELWTQKHPFKAESIHALAIKIVTGEYEQIPEVYSQDLKYLVDNLLSKDPEQRMTINEIINYIVTWKSKI